MSLMDDWGEGDPFPFDLSSDQLAQMAFLFGGVGDGQSTTLCCIRVFFFFARTHLFQPGMYTAPSLEHIALSNR